MKFFHLTLASNVDAILDHGLDPAHSASSLAAIFLTDDEFTAQNYAGMKTDPCVLLEVELPHDFCAQLLPDNYELDDLLQQMDEGELEDIGLCEGAGSKDCTWQQSLSICNQVACPVLIPASCVQVHQPAAADVPRG